MPTVVTIRPSCGHIPASTDQSDEGITEAKCYFGHGIGTEGGYDHGIGPLPEFDMQHRIPSFLPVLILMHIIIVLHSQLLQILLADELLGLHKAFCTLSVINILTSQFTSSNLASSIILMVATEPVTASRTFILLGCNDRD